MTVVGYAMTVVGLLFLAWGVYSAWKVGDL